MSDYEYYFSVRYSESRDVMDVNKVHILLWRCIPKLFLGIPYRGNKIILSTKWNITQNKDEIQRAMNELKLNIPMYEKILDEQQKEIDTRKQRLKQAQEYQKCVTRMIYDINGKKIDK